jgi:APA family basic amino acid/polyamine antiporter
MLTTFDAAMVVVGSILGAGAFVVSGSVAAEVTTPAGLLGAWLAGGLLALFGAFASGELGGLFPRGGGEYVYLREAYGPGLGFLSGWTSFWVGFPGSIATLAAGLGRTVAGLAGAEEDPLGPLVATGAVLVLTAVNVLGLRPGKWTQNILSGVKLIAFAALIGLAAFSGRGDGAHFVPFLGDEDPEALGRALIPVIFAYCGWNAATYVAGEIRSPERNLGRALIGGTAACVAIYLGLNAMYLYAMPLGTLGAARDAAQQAVTRLFDPGVALPLQILVVLVILSSLQATILTGPRIYQAMAADGIFFAPLARLHPRFRVPAVSLAVQAGLACVLLWTGSFGRLLTFTTVAIILFSMITVAAVYVLRVRRPDLPRRFRTPGYPVTPALFLAGNAWVLGTVFAAGAVEAIAGLGIVLAGVPVYLWYRHRSGERRLGV